METESTIGPDNVRRPPAPPPVTAAAPAEAGAREVVDAEAPLSSPPPVGNTDAAAATAAAPTKTVYQFVKNKAPQAEIVLDEETGEIFVFPSNPFNTSDEELAGKLRKIGARCHIFENEPTKA